METSNQSDLIFLNGVDALSGSYLTAPVTPDDLVELAQEEYNKTPPEVRDQTKSLSERKNQPTYGFNANLEDLAQARWGVIFAANEDDAIKAAIEPLIKHRADLLGFTPPVFDFRPDWNAARFLSQNGVEQGFGEVEKVPYYLLLVGDPSKVPFRFEYELDGEYAVGRLAFDSPDGYRAYVEQLIDYETSNAVPNSRDVVFWGTANEDDRATEMSSEWLVQPLYAGLDPKFGFNKKLLRGDAATKSNLASIYSRAQPPALLFTASHGLGYSKPDPEQTTLQGALVTQEWRPGLAISDGARFAGSDLTNGVNVRGLVHFAFACYGAGTPKQDDFAHGKSKVSPIIADQPFVANLPKQLLTRGVLAFIGHVERAWGYSFMGTTNQPMQSGFERAIRRLLRGLPVGHALRDQHDRGVQLSSSLLEDLNDMDFGKIISPLTIANKWIQRNDARAFILVGDPGAGLRVKDMQ
jgi:hypothetical protein